MLMDGGLVPLWPVINESFRDFRTQRDGLQGSTLPLLAVLGLGIQC